MTHYKHKSIAPIIEDIACMLTILSENESKTFLFKQYNKNDSFKGLAENIREWKIKFTDPHPTVKSELAGQLIALEEYFEERKVLGIYNGDKNTTEGTSFPFSDFFESLGEAFSSID